MLTDIGKKIKKLAVIWFYLGLLITLCAVVLMVIEGSSLPDTLTVMDVNINSMPVAAALVLLVAGGLCVWFSAWGLYGVGELVEANTIKAAQREKIARMLLNRQLATENTPVVVGEEMADKGLACCPACGRKQMAYRPRCWDCGAALK